MKSNPNRFWLIVILLGWAFDFLFWNKPGLGVNFFIYASLCIGTGIYLLSTDGLHIARRSSLLLLPFAFLAAVTFFRMEPLTAFLSVAMTIFLMGVFAITYLGGQWTQFGLLDYLFRYLHLFGSMIVRPIMFNAEVKKEQTSLSEKRSSHVWPVARGIVIALPIIAIFAALLSSADPVFGGRVQNIIDLLNIDNLSEYIFRLVYILLFAYALAGTYLHAAQKSAEPVDEKPLLSPFLGFTESAIVLGSVVILFALFVVVQFEYFFGGQTNIAIEGYTYSEYARKGFGELVAVAFISLLLLLGLGAITRRETDQQRRTFSILGITLVGLVIVMLISAYQRLVLYETAYGFSRLRTYTHVFMIWLGLLLVTVVVLEMLRRERAIGLGMILAFLGFAASLGLLNVDAFIVDRNVQRELDKQDGAELDVEYFLQLSDDAVPEMVDAFTDDSLPVSVRDGVGAALACKQYERDQNTQEIPWQAFHISRYRADILFAEISGELSAYQIIDKDWPAMVETPGGDKFSCYPYYD
jgi:hypothetical protein